MNKFGLSLVAGILMAASLSAHAGGRALGTDVIRMLDNGQPVGGSFNVIFQRPTKTGKNMVFNLALADNDDMMCGDICTLFIT